MRPDYDLDAYRRYVISGKMETPPPPEEIKPNINKAEARREAAALREKLKPLKQKITALEQEIARLSKERKALEKSLGNPELYAKDPLKAQEIVQQSGALLRALGLAEEQWLAAQEEYDAGMKEAEEA